MAQRRRVVQRDLDRPLAQVQEPGHPGGLQALALGGRVVDDVADVGDLAATGTAGVEARLELRGDLVELDQLEEDGAPTCRSPRRGRTRRAVPPAASLRTRH